MVPQAQPGFSVLVTILVLCFYACLLLPMVIGVWKALNKASVPGWLGLIPVYNLYVMCKLGDRSGWWMLLFLAPIVNLFALVGICVGVARNYGKSETFGFGLAILPFIFWPILGFGKSRYTSYCRL